MSAVLSSLKLVSVKRPTAMPVVQIRRNKLCTKLDEQIKLATASINGEQFAPVVMRNIRDRHTGEMKRLQVQKRVRQWWFIADNGKICLSVKYGMKTLLLGKDKTAVEVANAADLIKTLETLKQATIAGELDAQLEVASDRLGAGFKR